MNNAPGGIVRKVRWIGSSLRDLAELPHEVRHEIGYVLFFAQCDEPHPSIKILRGFGGAHVREVKGDDEGGTYRAVYTVQFKNVLYVLHVFQKKSKSGIATNKRDIVLINQRLARAVADFKERSAKNEQ